MYFSPCTVHYVDDYSDMQISKFYTNLSVAWKQEAQKVFGLFNWNLDNHSVIINVELAVDSTSFIRVIEIKETSLKVVLSTVF